MNIKSFIFAVFFAVQAVHCLEEKTWNMIVLGVGAVCVVDNLINRVPEFCKHDKHKKLNAESGVMAAKIAVSGWYLHKALSFLKKFKDPRYVMDSLDSQKIKDFIAPHVRAFISH